MVKIKNNTFSSAIVIFFWNLLSLGNELELLVTTTLTKSDVVTEILPESDMLTATEEVIFNFLFENLV